MPSFNAPGGGVSSNQTQLVERKVVVSTAGRPSTPSGQGLLTSVNIVEEPGGIQRGIYEFTRNNPEYTLKRIELAGGSREVPIYNHPAFRSLTAAQVNAVQEEAQKRPSERRPSLDDVEENNLYQCLIRQVEYYIAPAIIARITEIETALPSADGLCKIANPAGVSSVESARWILTAINASPVGDKYEVTREYTSIQEPEVAQFLYD